MNRTLIGLVAAGLLGAPVAAAQASAGSVAGTRQVSGSSYVNSSSTLSGARTTGMSQRAVRALPTTNHQYRTAGVCGSADDLDAACRGQQRADRDCLSAFGSRAPAASLVQRRLTAGAEQDGATSNDAPGWQPVGRTCFGPDVPRG